MLPQLFLHSQNSNKIKKNGRKPCRIFTVTAWILVFFNLLHAFSLPLNILAIENDGEEESSPASTFISIESTRVISIIPYVEKNENGAVQSVPVISREDIRANPNSTFLMIKLFISSEDAAKYYGNSLYIFKLETNMKTSDLAEQTPVTSFIVIKENAFEYNVKYLIDLSSLLNGEIFNKFVIATKTDSNEYIPISEARYIDNINCLSNKKDIPPASLSKKGLEVQMMGEARLLGVEHTTIKIFLNDFISSQIMPNTQKYTYEGEDFYFNIDKISEYDRKIKPLTNDGIKVTAILLLRSDKELREMKAQNNSDSENPEQSGGEIANAAETEGEAAQTPQLSPQQYLIHPNALEELESSGATTKTMFYGINTVTDSGVKYFSALMSFIADRYVKEDSGYGRIYNIILGDEIGNSTIYNNCGQIAFEDYVRDYLRAVRICDAAVRSRYGGARVYIPFDNRFASKSSGKNGYSNKDIIDLLCEYSQAEGNFLWNVAYHAYNDDPANPITWKETASSNNYETPVITMKNIDILCAYINDEKKDYLPDGERRKIMLSEQGYSSGDIINPEKDMELQAAAFVYGYLKSRDLPDISAFIYHRHVDSDNENQSYGLWTRAPDSTNEPKKKKKIYDVFKYMDTNKEAEEIGFAKDILGIKNFDEIAASYSESEERSVNICEATVTSVKKTSNTSISRFNQTHLSGFIATTNIEYLNIVWYSGESEKFKSTEKNLLVGFNRTLQGDYSGIFKSYDSGEALDLSEKRYIGLTVRIDTAIENIETIPLLLILEGEAAPHSEDKNSKNAANSTNSVSVINSTIVQINEDSSSAAESGSSGIFEGAANIKPNEDTTIYFDLKDFKERSKINKIKLLINPYYDGNNSVVSISSNISDVSGTVDSKTGNSEISSSADVAKYDFNLYVYNIVSASVAKLSLARLLLNIFIFVTVVIVTGYTALVIRAQIIRRKRRKRKAEQRRRRKIQQLQRRQPPQ